MRQFKYVGKKQENGRPEKFVYLIRALRGLTGYSLKDAKLAIEAITNTGTLLCIPTDTIINERYIFDLVELGFVEVKNSPGHQVRALIDSLLDSKEYSAAQILINSLRDIEE